MAEYIDRLKKNEYLKGWHDALTSALKESYSISTEDGTIKVIQQETIIGLGLSKDSPIHEIEPIDVIEREKIDKAIKEMKLEYYNLDSCENRLIASYWIEKAIKILKRNIGENK